MDLISLCTKGDYSELVKYYKNSKPVSSETRTAFISSCWYGHLRCAQFINNIEEQKIDRSILLLTSARGHLDVLQWLYFNNQLSDDDLLEMLAGACDGGHIGIIDWIFSLKKPINYQRLNEKSAANFAAICGRGKIIAARVLYGKNATFYRSEVRNAFYLSCNYGQFDVAMWLYSLDILTPIEISDGVGAARRQGHYDIVDNLQYLSKSRY